MAGSNTGKVVTAEMFSWSGEETVTFTGNYVMDKFCLDYNIAATC